MRVLAVDDDPIILELLVQFMAAIGEHQISTASGGDEAIALLEQSKADAFDCFMFDIQMPGIDGIELTRRVRANERFADVPILMLTAMSDKRYIDGAFAAGATDYVTKPFEVTGLQQRIDKLSQLSSSRGRHAIGFFADSADAGPNAGEDMQLHEPFLVYDLDNMVAPVAIENYVAQLSRSSLFGSSAFAFSLRKVEEFFADLSAFEFRGLIADIAEVISGTLSGHQFLMSYAGDGVFVCVTESGWRPHMTTLQDAINLALARSEIYNNKAERLHPRLVAGDAIRLVWRSHDTLISALADAHVSTEQARAEYERRLGDLWDYEQQPA